MGKVAVVDARDPEHADDIQEDRHSNGRPTPPDEKDGEEGQAQEYEGDGPDPFLLIGMIFFHLRLRIGIEPGDNATWKGRNWLRHAAIL